MKGETIIQTKVEENEQTNVYLPLFANGGIAWLFGVTGPLLLVMQSAEMGNLSSEITTSWIFSIYVVGGFLTVILSIYYRQPIAAAFSIPGAVLVGTSLMNHSFSDVVGAYLVTGIFILILGLSGVIHKVMERLPTPIMMGMVSGVLLPFGIDIFLSISSEPIINGIAFIVFLVISYFSTLAKRLPPILASMIVAGILVWLVEPFPLHDVSVHISQPQFFLPTFNLQAIGELVIPLALTVIAIQNSQGIGVLKSLDYTPPINGMTNWSGIGSIINGFFGAHSACIAGPMTAIIADDSSGAKENRYKSGVIMGVMWIIFGLFASVAVAVINMIPISIIQLLAGLALLSVLKKSLEMSFANRYKMGALFAFMITMSGVTFLNIGAPFWGIVGGVLISLIFEKNDFKQRALS
ncbi:benzoate/H(+) symporter BenE family transporter [Desertibacillus haloalkaliphilus]|uniref:benzoate/H(+) symporter BenE family transporter n=1 Tax=Desertibacillus haloalkaliphilus TaxID=1328930 RepID=UPI001C25A7D0|nr:benzoate/H(+) symporter BenE family transporter [Desertibacillus haloalkaliphilus]MBU8908218.1 benzoate/H(+) symporter BenE family transporter [Desertibacillus haloalkaliphilus]